MITWDLGRRCNYDCSYCPSHRHDNFSSHASLEELIDTTEFLFRYIDTISKHRKNKDFHVSFTGGEPTVNPNFIEFAKFLKMKYSNSFSEKFNLKLDLTTNGAMSKKIADAVIDNFDYVTVSYHAEANDYLKTQVRERITDFYNSKIKIKVNVMFHAQYFDECRDICSWLTTLGVKYIPRLIGDDPDSASSHAHLYTDEQKRWLKDQWNIEITSTSRPCCGGRTFGACSSNGIDQVTALPNREFKGWHCSVNWYFLHIEQQTRSIYHHQTCQARFDEERGEIGSLDHWQLLVATLEVDLRTNSMPIVVCPNKLCGCGLCTPKNVDRNSLIKSLDGVLLNTEIFSNE